MPGAEQDPGHQASQGDEFQIVSNDVPHGSNLHRSVVFVPVGHPLGWAW